MKPYMNLKGKGQKFYLFEDKVYKKFKRIFQKSERQQAKKQIKNSIW